MKEKLKELLSIGLLSLIPTLLVWAPFFFKLKSFWTIPLPNEGMATIVANYDGPLYIVVAKSLYSVDIIKQIVSFPLAAQYYAAHFPLFPLLIRAFAIFFGYPYAMLLVTLASSILAIYFFNKLARCYLNQKDSLWLSFVFCLFPARWLIVRSIGSPEPLFLATIIASIYFFRQKKYFFAGLFGALAQLTKSPGILLFAAYFLAIFVPKISGLGTQNSSKWLTGLKLARYWSILLIPLSIVGLFIVYKIRFNDFLPYLITPLPGLEPFGWRR
jgi:Gpi18-like mannosyltransferase